MDTKFITNLDLMKKWERSRAFSRRERRDPQPLNLGNINIHSKWYSSRWNHSEWNLYPSESVRTIIQFEKTNYTSLQLCLYTKRWVLSVDTKMWIIHSKYNLLIFSTVRSLWKFCKGSGLILIISSHGTSPCSHFLQEHFEWPYETFCTVVHSTCHSKSLCSITNSCCEPETNRSWKILSVLFLISELHSQYTWEFLQD